MIGSTPPYYNSEVIGYNATTRLGTAVAPTQNSFPGTPTPVQILGDGANGVIVNDWVGFYVYIMEGFNLAALSQLVRIYIGDTGQTLLVGDLLCAYVAASYNLHMYYVPIPVKAGSKLWAAVSANAGSGTSYQPYIHLMGLYGSNPLVTGMTAYGANVAASRGIDIDLSPTAGTWVDSPTTITTTKNHKGFILKAGNYASLAGATRWTMDIKFGSTIVFPSIIVASSPMGIRVHWVNIPAGTEINVRAVSSRASANLTYMIYGLG